MDENNFKASTSHESKRKRSKNLESTTINESFVDIEKNLIVSQIEQNTTEDIQLSSDKNHIQNECLFQTPTEIQGNLETNTAYKIKDEDNKGSETKLIQKELLTEEELESSQSTSKLESTTQEKYPLDNQVSSDSQDSTSLKEKTHNEDINISTIAETTMSIDALSDFLPSKEECLKESEVGHKTLGISIEVDKDKIEKNHDNKSEEKSYHDILKNSEVLAALEFNLKQLSTVKVLTLRKYHKNNSSIAKVNSLLTTSPTKLLEKRENSSFKPVEAFKNKYEPAYSINWEKISFSGLAASTNQHHNLHTKITQNSLGDVEIKQEHTNGGEKWNEKEKSSFVDLLKEFNEVRPVSEQCRQIAFKLKTKSATQVRSYLQKYYQKLQQDGVKTVGVPMKFHRYSTKPPMSSKKRSFCDVPAIFENPKSLKLSTKDQNKSLNSDNLDCFETLSRPQSEKVEPLSPQEIQKLRKLGVIDERVLENYLKTVEFYRAREEKMKVRIKEMEDLELERIKEEMEKQETFYSHNFDATCTNCNKGAMFGVKFTCADCISLHNISFYLCPTCMKLVNDGDARVRNQPQHSDDWHKFSIISTFVDFQQPTPIGDVVQRFPEPSKRAHSRSPKKKC